MATVEELREEIAERIDDDSIDDDVIDKRINRAIKDIASRVLLPALEAHDSVDTAVGVPYLSRPEDYGRNLFHAATARGKVEVLASTQELFDIYPLFGVDNEEGDIAHCALHGLSIAIHPIPTEITSVTLFYYALPAVLIATDDVGLYIPGDENLQEDLIFNYVLWKLYKAEEDGDEGGTPNTNFHRDAYLSAIHQIDLSTKQGRSRPAPKRKSWGI